MTDFNVDLAAVFSAAGGAVIGALGVMFRSGKAWQRVEDSVKRAEDRMEHMDEKITLICDELARRITVLENRVQYDGYYDNPRIKRRPPADDNFSGGR